LAVAIGFDTSCYTTSIAAVDAGGRVLASHRLLLPVQSGQRGLRQSEAVFAHVRQVPLLAERLRTVLAGERVCAVAASAMPASGEGSYMPVFLVGLGHARALAAVLDVPCYEVTHQQGHIAAGELDEEPMVEPFVALHLSGGTTELLTVSGGQAVHIGGSLDLHAGQLVDRVGVAMGLPFPAGPSLEALAMAGKAEALLPVSMADGDLHCHLSGAETRAMAWLQGANMARVQIAAEVFDMLARTVARLLAAACKAAGTGRVLVVGGVASSTLLRSMVAQRLQRAGATLDVRFGKPAYSADNAAGVAWLGMRRYLAEHGAVSADTQTD
jgi:N6-L-threonylcarbamoyladenine synthase